MAWIKAELVWGKPGAPPPLPKPVAICGPAPGAASPGAPCQGGGDVTFQNAAAPLPMYNGPYQLVVTGHASDGLGQQGDGAQNVKFSAAIPPPPVAHVTAAVNKDRSVTVSWDRDAGTPDLQSYWIYRKGPTAKDYAAIAQTPQVGGGTRVSVVDAGSENDGGPYSYQIESRRNGATGDNTSVVLSDRTKSVSNTVSVPAPPAGTPTTPPTQPQPVGSAAPPPVLKSTTSGVTGKVSSSPATTPTSEAVTPDPGFARGLPYASSNTQPGAEGEGGDNATVAITPSGGRHKSNTRGVLIPVAAGAVLFVGAFHLRWLKKQLDVPASTLS